LSEGGFSVLQPLIIIAGPTATGKSCAAVSLAQKINGSVISADSMQVYRGMDIGSAKITEEEMHGVKHYLVDCIDPHEEWNVVRFRDEAAKAVLEIRSEGKIPIVCGGTGFYIQALLYDIDFTETTKDDSFRDEMLEFARTNGNEALHLKLAAIDPASADAIHPNNVKRVIRALEFAKTTGGSMISSHNAEQRERPAAYDSVYFVLNMDRNELYERINSRVDKMFEEGLVEEVITLKGEGLTDNDVSMQGLGYKEILRALDGEYTIEEAREKIKEETRHFAKRQLTWFKREKNITWIDVSGDVDPVGIMTSVVSQHFI
jgi:tRNA dimethylallyltransferase